MNPIKGRSPTPIKRADKAPTPFSGTPQLAGLQVRRTPVKKWASHRHQSEVNTIHAITSGSGKAVYGVDRYTVDSPSVATEEWGYSARAASLGQSASLGPSAEGLHAIHGCSTPFRAAHDRSFRTHGISASVAVPNIIVVIPVILCDLQAFFGHFNAADLFPVE